MKITWETLRKYLGKVNKYLLTVVVFVIVTFFVGDSTLYKRLTYNKELKQLKTEIDHYTRLKEENQQKLNDLHSNDEALEKLAREQYKMTRPEEDLYLIVE
jgi:cell division protein FtsB